MNKDQFIIELEKIGINITDEQVYKFEIYYEMLIEENKKYNLTAITDEKEVYLKHFYDSLTLVKVINLENQTFCDIGSGAGFPAIPLKIIFSSLNVYIIESNHKKCNFINILIKKLSLEKVHIINERAEIYAKKNRELFDVVVSRAVAPLKHLLEYSIPLVKINGCFISLKSNVSSELINIKKYYDELSITLENHLSFYLPYEKSLRTILLYKKEKKTDLKYPRKYTEIRKKDI